MLAPVPTFWFHKQCSAFCGNYRPSKATIRLLALSLDACNLKEGPLQECNNILIRRLDRV